MDTFRTFLASLDPRIFYAGTAGLAWLLIYAWRKISMASWDAVTRKNPLLQNLPAIVLSGLISAAPAINKSFVNTLFDVIYGAFAGGAMSIVGHHMLKDSPLPYQGGGPGPKPQDAPPPASA
jgi:prepilin signal peptidase PulO-like enzyme (type II secretory pathway)